MDQSNKSQLMVVFLCAALMAATLATFKPLLQHDFINYDDPDYVTANEVVQKGLTGEGLKWALVTNHASNWHPLTWVSHMLDVTLFGMNSSGHHGTNLFFHTANSILLLLLLYQLTGAVWRSAFVAALFALHPLHVESVAWVAERKDVLSAFFGLLTLMAYARYVEVSKVQSRSAKIWYGGALTFLALGLMSKPMLVTWPFVMLLLDVWPLKRVTVDRWQITNSTWRRLVLEKLPFFAVAALSCVVTLVVQQGAVAQLEAVPLSSRLANSILAYVTYLKQTFWPTNLAVFYPFPAEFQPLTVAMAAALLVAITFLGIRLRRQHGYLLIGWLWFLGTLVPTIGLVQVGAQSRADRYTYVPLVGVFFALSWSLAALWSRSAHWKRFVPAAAAVAVGAATLVTHAQVQHWKNDRTLCTHAASVIEGNYVAWGGLGILDVKAADWPSAMTNLTRAYELAIPHHTERSVQYYVGVALQMEGKPLEALPHLQNCIVSAEMQPERDYRLGLSLIAAGRLNEAEAALNAALAVKAQKAEYNLGLAALWVQRGNHNKAEAIYQDTSTRHPESAVAQKAYADFLVLTKRTAEAEPYYAAAVKLKPADVTIRRAYASALQGTGKTADATTQLAEIYKRQSPTAQEAFELAELCAQIEQPKDAVIWYETAIAADSRHLGALNNLAWLLSTHPNDQVREGKRAVMHAEKAAELTGGKQAVVLGTLAAAYAEAGRFSDAVATTDKAIAQANEDQQAEVAKRNTELRELYLNKTPYREK